MADLKPLGSEKLQGMDKINRIMEIAKYKETPKTLVNELSTTNYTITLSDGKTYGIVKEKLGYVIKNGINESSMDYVEHMRHRKHYKSYSEAMKKLNLMVSEINRVTGYDENISLIGEQTDLKKKFILKLPKPKADKPAEETTPPAPPAPPAGDMGAPPAPPAGDMGTPPAPPMDDMGMGAPPADDMGMPPADDMGMPPADDMGMGEPPAPPMDDMGMGEPPSPPMDDMGMDDEGEEEPQGPTGLKSIQKLTGRLSQKIRSFEKEKGMDSQDIKYVLNSIISALELENLDEDDKDDIISKFDESDEYGEEGAGELDLGDEDMGMEDNMDMGMGGTPPPPPPSEGPMMESKVDKLLKSYFKISQDEKPIMEEKKKKDFLKQKLQRLDVKKEFVKLSESLSQLEAANEFHKKYKNAKFIGKTNKENLVFVVEGKQYRITPRGRVI